MVDRERLMQAIEFCKNNEKCDCCPYDRECGTRDNPIEDDTLALLREQKPRVMSLDELTEIYVEFKDNAYLVRLTMFDLSTIIMYMEDGICRLWTGKPTDEQREAVKWE